MGFAGNSKPPATLPGSWSSSPSRMGTPVKRQAATAGSHQREKLRIWVFPPQRNPARLLWHHLLSSHANVPSSIFCEDKGIKQTRSAIQRLAVFWFALLIDPSWKKYMSRDWSYPQDDLPGSDYLIWPEATRVTAPLLFFASQQGSIKKYTLVISHPAKKSFKCFEGRQKYSQLYKNKKHIMILFFSFGVLGV